MVHKEGIYVGYHFWPLFTVGFHFRICRSGHQNQTKQLSAGSQKKYSTQRREQADKPEKSKRSRLRSKLSLVKVLAQDCLCGKRLVEENTGKERTRANKQWNWSHGSRAWGANPVHKDDSKDVLKVLIPSIRQTDFCPQKIGLN